MYRYSTHSHQDPNVRASDADRDEIGERLRRHHAEGRIDAEEFQERIDSCYQAKTIGELRQLVNDLPRERDEQADQPFYLRRPWPLPLLPLLIAIWAASIVTGWHHGHWGLLWLIPLVFLIRFVMWPYGRWGIRRRQRLPRDF
jgi:Domain of unknown function (DUF1707)